MSPHTNLPCIYPTKTSDYNSTERSPHQSTGLPLFVVRRPAVAKCTLEHAQIPAPVIPYHPYENHPFQSNLVVNFSSFQINLSPPAIHLLIGDFVTGEVLISSWFAAALDNIPASELGYRSIFPCHIRRKK